MEVVRAPDLRGRRLRPLPAFLAHQYLTLEHETDRAFRVLLLILAGVGDSVAVAPGNRVDVRQREPRRRQIGLERNRRCSEPLAPSIL
jgi:hypothetical protein